MSRRKDRLPKAMGYCDKCDKSYGSIYKKCPICGLQIKEPRAIIKRQWKNEIENELKE